MNELLYTLLTTPEARDTESVTALAIASATAGTPWFNEDDASSSISASS